MPERDEPWKDVPADSDIVPGTEEPDPAEVEGDEGEEDDISHRSADLSHRDTLDERLAEEEPDRFTADRDDVGEIMAAESDQDDMSLDAGERDSDDDDDGDAADAALHITDRP